jgi:tetratricopeptide (TPR) repeat protein
MKHFWLIAFAILLLSCGNKSSKKEVQYSIDLLKKKVNSSLDQNDFNAVILYCDSLILLDSSNPSGLLGKGIALSSLGRNEEALSIFDLIISKDTAWPDPYGWRAFTRQNIGDTTGAMSDYNKSIARDSNYFKSRVNRGNLFRKQRKYEDAKRDFTAAFQIDSSAVILLHNMGLLENDMGNLKSAVYYYNKALQIEPKYYLFFDRGTAKLQMNLLEEAIADYSASISLNPNHDPSYLYRAQCYQLLGKTELMCDDLNRAAQLGNNNAKRHEDMYCKKILTK